MDREHDEEQHCELTVRGALLELVLSARTRDLAVGHGPGLYPGPMPSLYCGNPQCVRRCTRDTLRRAGFMQTLSPDLTRADPVAPPTSARAPIRRFGVFAILVVAVFGTSPVVTNGDSFLVAPTAYSLVHDGDLELSELAGPATDGGLAWIDGRPSCPADEAPGLLVPRDMPANAELFDHFSWVTAVVVTPLVLAFELPGVVGLDEFDIDDMVATGETGLFNLVGASLLSGAAVVLLALMAWLVLDLPPRRRAGWATAVGALVAFGTPMWSTLSRALWNQTTTVLFLSAAMLCAARIGMVTRRGLVGPNAALALGVAAGAAFATRPTAAIFVAAFGLWFALRHRHLLARYVAGGAIVAVPWFVVNVASYGTLLPPYYASDRVGMRSDVLEAMAANLVSPNRGLFVFSSIAVLAVVGAVVAVRRRETIEAPLVIAMGGAVLVHLIVVSGSGEDWWAGVAYGPRFMADTIPALVLLALPAVQRLATAGRTAWTWGAVGLAAASVVMNAPGAWSKPAACWALVPVEVNAERVWDWRDPQAFRPIKTMIDGASVGDAIFGRCDSYLAVRSDSPPSSKPRGRVIVGKQQLIGCLVAEAAKS